MASQLAPNQRNETVLIQDNSLDPTGAWPFQESHCGYVSSGYLVNRASRVANGDPFDDIDISDVARQISGAVTGFINKGQKTLPFRAGNEWSL